MTTKVITVNPARRTRKKMATRKNPARKNPTTPRRRRRRKNPGMHPALVAGLGTLAGAALGGGGDVALRYTSLSPYARGGILAGVGVLGAVGLSFVDGALGAGVGGGLAAVGTAEIIMQATAPTPKTADANATMQLAAVRAELGRVSAQMAQMPRYAPEYAALSQAGHGGGSRMVYVDEEDLAYLG